MTTGQRSTIRVEKTPEGLFRASVENENLKAQVPPVVDSDQMTAIRLLGDQLNKAYVKGEVE